MAFLVISMQKERKMTRSFQEKELYKRLTQPTDAPLPFELKCRKSAVYGDESYYEIPEDKKEEVFRKLWPFADEPSMDKVYIDIHEDRQFTLKDFMVIRFDGYDMIVSPYFFSTGGTLLDFIEPDAVK